MNSTKEEVLPICLNDVLIEGREVTHPATGNQQADKELVGWVNPIKAIPPRESSSHPDDESEVETTDIARTIVTRRPTATPGLSATFPSTSQTLGEDLNAIPVNPSAAEIAELEGREAQVT